MIFKSMIVDVWQADLYPYSSRLLAYLISINQSRFTIKKERIFSDAHLKKNSTKSVLFKI